MKIRRKVDQGQKYIEDLPASTVFRMTSKHAPLEEFMVIDRCKSADALKDRSYDSQVWYVSLTTGIATYMNGNVLVLPIDGVFVEE